MLLFFRQVASSETPVKFQTALDVSHVIKGRKDITGIEPLQVDLAAKSSDGEVIEVQGTLSTELDMTCSRCLKPLKHAVTAEFTERFKQSDDPETDMQAQDEDDDLEYVTGEKIDLVPYIEETLLLNLPFAAVCKDTCKGLCPICGADRNERECGCNTDKIDPRLAALGDFFKK